MVFFLLIFYPLLFQESISHCHIKTVCRHYLLRRWIPNKIPSIHRLAMHAQPNLSDRL